MRPLLLAVLLCGIGIPIQAADPVPQERENKKEKPIRALLVTGGCCHDYDRQKLILTKGISARANVEWTIVQQGGKTTNTKIPLYEDPNWAEGFDIVVHNECFSNVPDVEWVERILKPHREGTPAVLIHCAMHCYRTGTDKWFEFVGVQSPGHGPHYSYTVENLKPEHPIMEDFGKRWVAPKGELYHTIKLWDSATPLAQAKRQSDNQPQTCIWTNEYGKARVFCTTIGHYNETMADPGYLDMVTRGLLWAVKRDPKTHFRPSTHKVDEEIRSLINAPVAPEKTSQLPQKCCGDGNLVTRQPAKASSEETGKKNFAKNAVDGDLRTRWCANGPSSGETWQVELAQPAQVRSLRIHWEKDNTAYQYKVDASPDGKTWNTIVDQSQNKKKAKITPHKVDASNTKHLRVTFLGSSTGVWGSFWEFEAYAGDLPELPERLTKSDAPSASIADVQAPPGFEVHLFGKPPEVNYPVCLTAAPTGEVFVGVDEQGSLGKEPGRGKILRLIDRDGDGQAEFINEFAKIDRPRGLIYDQGTLWVLHPPFLSVLHDEDSDGPHCQGALGALRLMHTKTAVDGLFQQLSKSYKPEQRLEILTALMRLYHREGEYKSGWWGTRPDTTGPYYDRQTWSESERIGEALKVALAEADKPLAEKIREQIARHHVPIEGVNNIVAKTDEPETPIELPKVDESNPNLIANLQYEEIVKRTMEIRGNVQNGQVLFRRQSCMACHTYINGQSPKGPHLVDIGKRYKKPELIESLIKPSEKIAQGFDTYSFLTMSGQAATGFVVSESAETVTLREANGLSKEIPQQEIEERIKRELSMMPQGIVNNLTPKELADLIAYLQSLK